MLAVDAVDLVIHPGEIVALLGQNGAGKSTVIQILAGVHPHGSYDGAIAIDGQPFAPANVAAAEAAGVVLIPQEVNVVPELTVAENMFLNNEPTRFGFVDRLLLHVRAGEVLRDFDVDVDPRARMGSLDLATQQLVVIARALSKQARLLILDEPTAALTETGGAASLRTDADPARPRGGLHLRLAPPGGGLRRRGPHSGHARWPPARRPPMRRRRHATKSWPR